VKLKVLENAGLIARRCRWTKAARLVEGRAGGGRRARTTETVLDEEFSTSVTVYF
jgi:hypothetical protein